MKHLFKYTLLAATAIAAFVNSSCDKVSQPTIILTTLDTTIYPGNFVEYEVPTFEPNTNTDRNILIEDYTGHRCGACPGAATIAHDLEVANPGRVFVATIHAGPSNNGITDFQKTIDPYYTRDFTTPEGLEMASTFFQLGVGFFGNPRGAINRIAEESGSFMFGQGQWADKTNAALSTPLQANIQAKSNYFPETNGAYLHIETEFLDNLEGEYNITAYVLQKKTVGYQYINGVGDVPDYEHHNVHIGNVFNETWGRSVASGTITAGTKVYTDMSYTLPDGLTNEDLLFQIYVYDRNSYEILQVIEHDF